MEKLVKFFSSAKSIWSGIFIFFTVAAFAGNTQWVQISEYKSDQRVLIVQQINREISELEVKLLYTDDAKQVAMIKAIIINKKTQIKNIKEK